MREQELIVFRPSAEDELLLDMTWVMENWEKEGIDPETGEEYAVTNRMVLFEVLSELIDQAGSYGFHGNLWHCYLSNFLVNHENSFSCGCEGRGSCGGSINQAAHHDMEIFREMFTFDFAPVMEKLQVPGFAIALDYEASELESKVYNTRICKRICDLAKQLEQADSTTEMLSILTQFYKEFGVGKFGLHKSFRIVHDEFGVHIDPILNIAHVRFDDLVGYDTAKNKLRENTDAFVQGKKANNCLLFGDAGTGKSSCIKAIANEYFDQGLRIIEVYKHQFQDLNEVIAQIKRRNYKFVIYMDDLSFEDFEIEYKYLKAVIEGGLEKRPDNVLIYATSNRRHLIKETWQDRDDVSVNNGIHKSDNMQEKLSLAYRFGVTIYFGSPDKKQFQQIVTTLAERNGITLSEEELLLEANKWELSHGGLSGRCAQQFVDYLLGKG